MESIGLLLASLTPKMVLLAFTGTVVGVTVGAVPGLTATMAIALLIPFTYGQSVLDATAFLVGIYVGGMFGGAITAILFGIPGAPANAATLLDGYPLARQGFSRKAIQMATLSSAIGGLFSTVVLMLGATTLARVALAFSAPEYLAVSAFGLSVVAGVTGRSFISGVISALLGLLIGTVGLDIMLPYPRYTFGQVQLLTGFSVVPVLIGLFAYSQVFRLLLESDGSVGTATMGEMGPGLSVKDIRQSARAIFRSSVLGTFIGILPAAGPNIAAFLGYSEGRRNSRRPQDFGRGSLEGVASAEAANNAVPGGALVPLLSFGIPGDTVTALLLGALILHGYKPGPLLLKENPEIILPLYAVLIIANVALLLFGFGGAKYIVGFVQRIDRRLLIAVVALFGAFGGFAATGRVYDALVTVAFGIIGYLLERVGISVVPMSLTVILGPLIERYLRQGLIGTQGDVAALFFRPIAGTIWILTILVTWSIIRLSRRLQSTNAQR